MRLSNPRMTSQLNNKQSRCPKSSKFKSDEIGIDIKMFNGVISKLDAWRQKGVGEYQKLSMESVVHVGESETITYEMKDICHTEWGHHLVFQVLRKYSWPGFDLNISKSDENNDNNNSEVQNTALPASKLSDQEDPVDGLDI